MKALRPDRGTGCCIRCPWCGVGAGPGDALCLCRRPDEAVQGPVTSAQQMMISGQRQVKSAAEIALIQTAMEASLSVQKAVHAGLRAGVLASEVKAFIAAAHRTLGLNPLFAHAVQFGGELRPIRMACRGIKPERRRHGAGRSGRHAAWLLL